MPYSMRSSSRMADVDNFDTLSAPVDDRASRRRSNPIVLPSSASAFESLNAFVSGRRTTGKPLSPPPTPKSPSLRHESLHHRLRSNSGLALHTNNAALRRYTDYNPDGSTKLYSFDESTANLNAAASAGYRGSMAFHSNESFPNLAIPDFFSREVMQMVMHNPVTSHRLWQFAKSRGGGENMEFLAKIEDYTRSVNDMISSIAAISTTFTGVAATNSLRLPPQLSRSLNADVKQVSSSVLPALEGLFVDAKHHIEQRLMKDIYPEFVKHQLSLCLKTSLSTGRATTTTFNFEYPGLGDAFCLTDPYKADNPIVYASDGFVNATGYSRPEIIPRNCRFLQGPLTDSAVVQRIKDSIFRQTESVDLVLNYRKDGQPFWNLLYICPLKATNGKVRFYLGGQINVSETIGSHKDVLRILNATTGPAVEPSPEPPPATEPVDLPARKSRKLERGTSIRGRDRSSQATSRAEKPPSSSKSFFKPFRKQHPPEAQPLSSPPPSRQGPMSSPAVNGSNPGLEQTLQNRAAAQHLALPTQVDDFAAAYARFMVLQFVPASSYGDVMVGSGRARLKITFCSRAVLECLGLGPGAQEAVLYHDVFSVLSELAGSPSITSGFKGAVRERLCVGDSASIDLAVPSGGMFGGQRGRKGSVISTSGEERGKRGEVWNRTPAKTQKLMSHWTPLKDVDGRVAWVILVITPVLS